MRANRCPHALFDQLIHALPTLLNKPRILAVIWCSTDLQVGIFLSLVRLPHADLL